MTWWIVPSGDRETDLVVELGRRGDVAFLLDVKSHAAGPDQDAATLRSERLRDNCLGGPCPYASSRKSPLAWDLTHIEGSRLNQCCD